MFNKIRKFFGALGPGLITGASDNDPAGVYTYSVTGATLGYRYLWLSLLSFPLMVAVQDMAARIGVVKEEGLGQVIKENYGRGWLTTALIVLLISNTATIGADIAGVAAGLELLTGLRIHWFVIPVALFIILVEVFWSYKTFARYLRYLTLILFAYVIAGFITKPDWMAVLRSTFVPSVSFDKKDLAILVGLLGTTISPYMFFWQASEEVEEIETNGDRSEISEKRGLADTISGMFYAVLVFYFIVLTSAATLHAGGHTSINTAADAARALEPIAGKYASVLFSVGIVGAGLIAIPVLAGATAYPMTEWFGFPEGLDKSVKQATLFYIILATAVMIGMIIALLPINPIDALVYSQVLMGLLTPVLLILMMLVARNKEIMGEKNVNTPFFNVFGWLAVLIMIAADAAMLWTLIP